MKTKSFTNLEVWKKGHELVLEIYKIAQIFPAKEQYILTSQMLRCVISITSNIAEGFSRRGKKDKTRFYYIALGSLTELQNQLFIAKDLKYINSKVFKEIADKSVSVQKMLNALISSINKK